MKSKILLPLVVVLLAVLRPLSALAQGSLGDGTFQNLDFEQADLSPLPPGQLFGEAVAASDAIPGWTAYLGTSQISTIVQDNQTLGNASIDIFGPKGSDGNYNSLVLEGLYSVLLQPGVGLFGTIVGASISQTGMVPANAASLWFRTDPSGYPFSITLGGQTLSPVPLGTGPNYVLFGAAIPSFAAGHTETLTVSEPASLNQDGGIIVDAFSFSSLTVPEPPVLALFAICGLALAAKLQRKRA